jgi:hypothetical protein
MNTQLSALLFTDSSIKGLTGGFKSSDILCRKSGFMFFFRLLLKKMLWFLIFFSIIFFMAAAKRINLLNVWISPVYVIILFMFIKSSIKSTKAFNEAKKSSYLHNLLKDIEEFNDLVKGCMLSHQLAQVNHTGQENSSGNENAENIQKYTQYRKDLENALKTERIFRENSELVNNKIFRDKNYSEFQDITRYNYSNKAESYQKEVESIFDTAIETHNTMKEIQ